MPRFLRLTVVPVLVFAGSALGWLYLERNNAAPTQPYEIALQSLYSLVATGFGCAFLFSLGWLSFIAWRYRRFNSGAWTGDCDRCGWSMTLKDGRWGPYRRCRSCGNKRSI